MNKYIKIEGLRVYLKVNQQSFMIHEALPNEPDSVEWMADQLRKALNTMKQEIIAIDNINPKILYCFH